MHITARDRLLSVTPHDSDGVVALRLADCLLEEPGSGGRYYPFIAVEDRQESPMPFTHKYKNLRIFMTADREAAAGWIIQAALAGLAVYRARNLRHFIGGMGTIADIRQRVRS
jgi:hypothetical protein